MFDFDHWCMWVETECGKAIAGNLTIEFQRGKPSPKRGAAASIKSESKLLQFAFWETGEADLFGIDLTTGKDVSYFLCRRLDDTSFERVFRESLLAAA